MKIRKRFIFLFLFLFLAVCLYGCVQEIQRETRHLEELRAEEEKRREKVIEAKKDTSSIEKLREKKLDAYHKAEAKSEEAFIEEFVSTMRVNAANA